ncbi:hypothetical protein PVAP13_9NG281673 [Panicum virgatum]|uniref:Uncharacterized protein n=1 Tax=Panicum virgatum TaxID=38727 RepID=A0A8T0MDN8_PANVG|nr:hypothetical protein PVAP13_9NG281673 [Panicum virgatum]
MARHLPRRTSVNLGRTSWRRHPPALRLAHEPIFECFRCVREATLQLGSIEMGGRILRLVRHEDAEFRFICHYRRRVELAVTNFPPEHWAPERIDTAFSALGQVCYIDQSCLVVVDELLGGGIANYSAVRVVVLVDADRPVLQYMIVRNHNGGLAGIATLRVVNCWEHPPGAPPPPPPPPTTTTSPTLVGVVLLARRAPGVLPRLALHARGPLGLVGPHPPATPGWGPLLEAAATLRA